MKKKIMMFLAVFLVYLAGCAKSTLVGNEAGSSVEQLDQKTETVSTDYETMITPTLEEEILPETNDKLYSLLMEQWKSGDVTKLYEYASDEIKSLVDEDRFNELFMYTYPTFGSVKDVKNEVVSSDGGIDLYTATLGYENAEADIEVYIGNLKIMGFNWEMRFLNSFDKECAPGITEHYFLLESGDYLLDAVYTHTDKVDAPAVLLIPGSGKSDYNETNGLLMPFEDIALGLAEHGVNSLRVEKRTNRFDSDWTAQWDLDEEYFIDYKAALEWLGEQPEIKTVMLLGHSLGAQISVSLAEQYDVSGLILFNGSARHLAQIVRDQHCALDPAKSEYYRQFSQEAMMATTDTAEGIFYYALSDYYWADYNNLSTIDSLKSLNLPTLIINSRKDNQLYDEDIDLWQKEFGNDDKVTILVYNDISHYGYKSDIFDESSLYKRLEFSNELIEVFARFCE